MDKKLNETLKNKKLYNQYFTNSYISKKMSENIKFMDKKKSTVRILDPGSGYGYLGIEAINYISINFSEIKKIYIDLYEIDLILIDKLRNNLLVLQKKMKGKFIELNFNIYNRDFLIEKISNKYDLIIMNPPYGKIKQSTPYSLKLKQLGINTVNTYTSFIKKALINLDDQGIAIFVTPRSFMNGKYHMEFRKWLFNKYCLNKIIWFESRRLFDGVLQEVMISVFQNKKQTESIDLEYFKDKSLKSSSMSISYKLAVDKNNKMVRFFSSENDILVYEKIKKLNDIKTLGINVSTGPVVYFRQPKEYLKKERADDACPYIFSEHIGNDMKINWPIENPKKYNYLLKKSNNRKIFRKSDTYVLIKRVTSKEENRRIHASVLNEFKNYDKVALDNSVNFFYFESSNNNVINVMKGLCVYLNSSLVDKVFRQFSGSTQVNIFDLKILKYPSLKQLSKMSLAFNKSQEQIDFYVRKYLED